MTHHIDDYIEPQIAMQATMREIDTLTRKKKFAAAFEANMRLQAESHRFANWLWKNMEE